MNEQYLYLLIIAMTKKHQQEDNNKALNESLY